MRERAQGREGARHGGLKRRRGGGGGVKEAARSCLDEADGWKGAEVWARKSKGGHEDA
jgi:hypothetical protein